VEAQEVGDAIAEAHHEAERRHEERFRRGAAVFLGVLGMLLAIASLGGEDAMKETINANIKASDTYAFYQARNERQTGYRLAADALQVTLASRPELAAEQRRPIEELIAGYQATIAQLENGSTGGKSKKELLAEAHEYEARRDHAQLKDANFDYSRALFQIAIVLGSVSIVAVSRSLLALCAVIALVATLFGINGFLLLAPLPFG